MVVLEGRMLIIKLCSLGPPSRRATHSHRLGLLFWMIVGCRQAPNYLEMVLSLVYEATTMKCDTCSSSFERRTPTAQYGRYQYEKRAQQVEERVSRLQAKTRQGRTCVLTSAISADLTNIGIAVR